MRKRESRRESYAAWQKAVRDLREREIELARSIAAAPGGVSLETTQLRREVAQMRLLTESLHRIALAGVMPRAAMAATG
jgi:hypothetical protein